MNLYLSNNWDLGLAMGELISSFLLTFIILISRSNTNNKKLSILFGVATLFSIVIGWTIGSQISGRGHGISLITPISAIFMSFHFQAFNALWFIIIFQIIGTIIGVLLYFVYKLFLLENKIIKSKEIDISYKKHTIKSLIFQPMLIITIFYIPQLDITSYSTGMLFNALLLSMSISLILYLTKDLNFILFSPWISLSVIFIDGIKRKKLKSDLINFTIEFFIQLIIIIPIIAFDIYIFKGL